jgi:putative transposase
MARLPRLFLPDFPQMLRLQALPHLRAFESREHYARFLSLLESHARILNVQVHAYALLPDAVLLLVSTLQPGALGQWVQAVNREFVPWRMQGGGSLWLPRFKSTVVQPGLWALRAALWVDSAPLRAGVSTDAALYPFCSFAAHTGVIKDKLLTDLPVYFSLGNTPFDRQMAFRQLAEQGIGEAAAQRLAAGLEKAWAVADEVRLQAMQATLERPLQPRPRGRPRKV